MKIRLLGILSFLLNLGIVLPGLAQKKLEPHPFGDVINFDEQVTDSMRASGIWGSSVGVKSIGNLSSISKRYNRMYSPVMFGVKLNPTLTNYRLSSVRSFYKNYAAFRISDQSDAVLIALGITKNNINDFRYHVVVNDSAEVIHWSPIPKLEQGYGATVPYGFIGKFNYPDKQVLVEVINIKDYRLRDGVIFDWRKNFRPVIIRITAHGYATSNHDTLRMMERKPSHGYRIKYDSITGAPSEIKFAYGEVNDMQILLKEHESVPYITDLYKIEDGKRINLGSPTDRDFQTDLMFFSMHNYQPGNYEIIIQPRVGESDAEGQEVHIQVVILPPTLAGRVLSRLLTPYVLGCLIISVLFFVIYRRRLNIRLARSIQAKQIISLKLMAIRSQLNPHFMFNALTSIQNLVNKKDIESANHYLSRFADLTRKVLNTGEKDLISLEDELKILDDYLQMEQLRFNFKYELNVGNGVNVANTEVPAMLLQPFVENAVKHGVAKLREKGLIKIEISQPGKDLVFSIIDNGPGFKQEKQDGQNSSFGLKLSEERIGLLNEIYKSQPTKLNIQSAETGTNVTVTLTNWVS